MSGSTVLGQTTQPWAKNDVALGTSVANAYQSLKQVKADASVKDSGSVTGTSYNRTFIQSVEFDNLDGVRHNAQGNLLGVNFGTNAGGFLYSFATRGITTGQTAQPASTQLYNFSGTNTATTSGEKARVGGLSIAPNNLRIALSSNDVGVGTAPTAASLTGRVIVMDYAAGGGDGTGAVTNYRSVEVPGLRTGTSSRTSSTAWLDNNNVLVVGGTSDFSSTGDLYRITLGTGTTLTPTKVASNLFGGQNLTFTNALYEPTVSPFIFVSGTGQIGGVTVNKIVVVDPRLDFSTVKTLSYDVTVVAPQAIPEDGVMNSLREMAFDSKGNLVIVGYAGSDAQSNDYTLRSLINAQDLTVQSDNGLNLVGILRKDQTSNATTTKTYGTGETAVTVTVNGTSASFGGLDVALSNVDTINADVVVNIRQGNYTQNYFGDSPLPMVIAKLTAGTIASSDVTAANGTGVGYAITPGTGGGTLQIAYVLKGDANLSRGTVVEGVPVADVGFDDLLALAQNYDAAYNPLTSPPKTWSQGDFDYNGIVNFDDLLALAQNYGGSVVTGGTLMAAGLTADFAADWALAVSLVPEPASLGVVFAAAAGLRRRRVG